MTEQLFTRFAVCTLRNISICNFKNSQFGFDDENSFVIVSVADHCFILLFAEFHVTGPKH